MAQQQNNIFINQIYPRTLILTIIPLLSLPKTYSMDQTNPFYIPYATTNKYIQIFNIQQK